MTDKRRKPINGEVKRSDGGSTLDDRCEVAGDGVHGQRRWDWPTVWEKLTGNGVGAVLARGAAGAFIVKALGAGLGFVVHVLLARLMGVTEYGIYIYAYTWVAMLVLLGRVGMDKGFVRFIPEYAANGQWGRLRGILRFGATTVLVASAVVAMLGAGVVWMLRNSMHSGQPETFWVAFTTLPVMALLWLCRGALQGLKRAVQSLVPEQVIKHLLVGIGALILYLWLDGSLRALEAMIVTLGAMLGSLALSLVFLYRGFPEEIRNVEAQHSRVYWLRIAAPMVLIAGMHVVMKKTDLLMIGAFVGPEAAGIYGAVTRISTLVIFGLSAVNVIAAPIISELYHTNQREELQRMLRWAAWGIFGITIALTVPLLAIGDQILLLFGTTFAEGYLPLIILLSGQIFNALAGSVGFMMTMTGHQDQAAIILAINAVLNVILNAILVPQFGMVGGAIATAVTIVIWNMWMVWYVVKKLEINPTIFGRLKAN